MTIREATLDDVDDLVLLGAQFLAGSIYGIQFAENFEQMDTLATFLVTHDDGAILVAEDEEVGLVGMLALLCSPHPWSGERCCGELAFFVDRAARGSTGTRLLSAGRRWAREQGAVKMLMVSPAVPDVEEDRVADLYKACGFEPLERGWIRPL